MHFLKFAAIESPGVDDVMGIGAQICACVLYNYDIIDTGTFDRREF